MAFCQQRNYAGIFFPARDRGDNKNVLPSSTVPNVPDPFEAKSERPAQFNKLLYQRKDKVGIDGIVVDLAMSGQR